MLLLREKQIDQRQVVVAEVIALLHELAFFFHPRIGDGCSRLLFVESDDLRSGDEIGFIMACEVDEKESDASMTENAVEMLNLLRLDV